MLSEALAHLFGYHQEFLLDTLRRRRPFSHEGDFDRSLRDKVFLQV